VGIGCWPAGPYAGRSWLAEVRDDQVHRHEHSRGHNGQRQPRNEYASLRPTQSTKYPSLRYPGSHQGEQEKPCANGPAKDDEQRGEYEEQGVHATMVASGVLRRHPKAVARAKCGAKTAAPLGFGYAQV